MQKIELSVRNLVEFLLCHGDIQSGFTSIDRALLGARIHRKIQKERGENYESEVFLKHSTTIEPYQFIVEGRADGIFSDGDTTVIEEIKTVNCDLSTLETSPSPTHWGQAKCYAYFYACEQALTSIDIQLTYYHIKTEEMRHIKKTFTKNELADFYHELLHKYLAWADMQVKWQDNVRSSAKAITFPYETYRFGQREFAAAVYKSIRAQIKLYAIAPTGIGKTMASLFGAIKSIGEGHSEKILYLTAKTTTRQEAEKALIRLKNHGLSLKFVTLTAKDKICFLEERNCRPEVCLYAKGYYDRLLPHLFSMLQTETSFSRSVIESYARAYHLCPYELSLDLCLWCDVIIGDYNHLFDPRVSLRRLWADASINPYVYLIDEAHNLVDRSRHMYSAALSKAPFLALKRLLGKQSSLAKSIDRVNRQMLLYRKKADQYPVCLQKEAPSDLLETLFLWSADAGNWLSSHENAPQYADVLTLYFSVQNFLKIASLYDENYQTWFKSYQSDVTIKLFCLNPSNFLNERMHSGVSSILFSATMIPLSHYRELLGGEEQDRLYAISSPFPAENMCLVVPTYISTKYQMREQTLPLVCRAIYDMVSVKKGHYMAFFPSYQYLNAAADYFSEHFPSQKIDRQNEQMTEEERDIFLQKFRSNEEDLLTFCVLGGAFSEGIDLAGTQLIGVAIVGVGMPQINFEQNMLRDYFQNQNGHGLEHAYRNPGMNKVLQAAGRVIRTETDRGVVLLIDDRYTQSAYQALMPPHWRHRQYTNSPLETKQAMESFWKSFSL